MGGLREKDVKGDIKEALDHEGIWYFMPLMMGYGRTGIPDFICCWGGRLLAIEAKGKGGELRPSQSREIEDLESAGATVWVVGPDHIPALEEELKRWKSSVRKTRYSSKA